MSTTRILVEVWENRQRKEASEFAGPVELGGQRDRDEALFGRKQENGISRWVIARRDETTIGRNQILLTPISNERVRVTNGSDKQPIRFLDRADLAPGSSCDVPLPLHVILSPTKTVHVRKAAPVVKLCEGLTPPWPPARSVSHTGAMPATGRGSFEPAEGVSRDAVDCTVFAPPEAPPGDCLMVQVFAHKPEQAAAAQAAAREFDADAARRGVT